MGISMVMADKTASSQIFDKVNEADEQQEILKAIAFVRHEIELEKAKRIARATGSSGVRLSSARLEELKKQLVVLYARYSILVKSDALKQCASLFKFNFYCLIYVLRRNILITYFSPKLRQTTSEKFGKT
jgi:hypothetical protein